MQERAYRGDGGDGTDLLCEVAGHEIDVIRQLLPGAREVVEAKRTAELAVDADVPDDRCERGAEQSQGAQHFVCRLRHATMLRVLCARERYGAREVAGRDGLNHADILL